MEDKIQQQKASEKVKRKVVETSFEDGGIRMINLIDFQEYLNLQWVGKLFYATDEDNWKQVPFWHLEKLGNRDNIFNINCNSSEIIGIDQISNINNFWKEVWTTYVNRKRLTKQAEVNETKFGLQNLFNNHLVKYKNRITFFQQWIRQGLVQVKDIIHPNNNRLLTL